MIEPFLSAVPVLKKLEDAGFEAYFVGGAVRDFLLHKEIHDVDIATSATPGEVKQLFPKTIDVGIEHGTILVLYKNESYEITTFRAESEYLDFRRPKEVSFIRSLKKDIERRDFTINAMAMDKSGKIYDFFAGQSSIGAKEIKTVGNAEERFQEDALRMMRAVRFVSQLGFAIEANTLEALEKMAYILEKIAIERKRGEFEKLLAGSYRKRALEIMLKAKQNQFLPGLKNKQESLHLLLTYYCEELNLNEMWTLLLYCLQLKNKDAENLLRDWRLPLKQIRAIQFLTSFLYQRIDREWSKYDLYVAKLETIISVEKIFNGINKVASSDSINHFISLYQELPIKERSQLKVSGNDVKNLFAKSSGPWINETLIKIEQAVLEGIVENDKTKIKEWLLRCNQK